MKNNDSVLSIIYIIVGATIFFMSVGAFLLRLLVALVGIYLIFMGLRQRPFAYFQLWQSINRPKW